MGKAPSGRLGDIEYKDLYAWLEGLRTICLEEGGWKTDWQRDIDGLKSKVRRHELGLRLVKGGKG